MFNELIAREWIDCLEVTLIIWGKYSNHYYFLPVVREGYSIKLRTCMYVEESFSFYLEPHILLFRRPITDHEAARRARECEGSK